MHHSRITWNQVYSLLFLLPHSHITALPSKPNSLVPVLVGRDIVTAPPTFNPQINQDVSNEGDFMGKDFPSGETTANDGNVGDNLLGSKNYSPQAELISTDTSQISECNSPQPEDGNPIPSGKLRLRRQNTNSCPAKPAVEEQKPAAGATTPKKGSIPFKAPESPGLLWDPFNVNSVSQPPAPTDGNGCGESRFSVSVCFAPWKSTGPVPMWSMGLLNPVNFCMSTPCPSL